MNTHTFYLTFHGGTDKSEWNNIHAFTTSGDENNPPKVLDKDTLPTTVSLLELRGMTFGPDGHLYVANAYKGFSQILKFDGSLQTNGQHAFIEVFIKYPGTHPFQAIFGPDSNLYVANQDTLNVCRYQGPNGQHPGTPIGTGGVFVSGLTSVRGIAFGPDSNFYVVDEDANRIYKCDPMTGQITGHLPDPEGHLNSPVHIVFKNNILYIGNSGKDNLLYFDTSESSATVQVYVHKSEAQLDKPSGLCFATDGYLYVASRKGKQVNRYKPASDGHSALFDGVFLTSNQLDDYPEFLIEVG